MASFNSLSDLQKSFPFFQKYFFPKFGGPKKSNVFLRSSFGVYT